MFLRQNTIATEPPQLVSLFYDSRSNAEKPPQEKNGGVFFEDDYKQSVRVSEAKWVIADHIVDMAEKFRAEGEIECVKMLAALKFDERVDRDTVLKTFINKKKAQQLLAGAQRVPPPPGFQP